MRDDFDSGLVTELEKVVTAPVYLVEFGFISPVYLSSKNTVTVSNNTWLAANMDVKISQSGGTVKIFNEGFTVGGIVLQQGTAGRSIKIYQLYDSHITLIFKGEMGDATIDEYVSIKCKPYSPRKTPTFSVLPPVFNHIPKPGLRIETPRQVIILEGK